MRENRGCVYDTIILVQLLLLRQTYCCQAEERHIWKKKEEKEILRIVKNCQNIVYYLGNVVRPRKVCGGRKMNLEQMKRCLEDMYAITGEKSTATAEQLKLDNGAVINVFNNGNYNVQGKNSAEVKKHIEQRLGTKKGLEKNKKVFIVYGHDEQVRNELENILRRWGLEPIILDKMASGGKTIIEKLESQMPEVGYGIVLATADDEGHRKDAPDEKMCRCRQNVVLELGMLLSKLGRERLAILLQYPDKMERPSDIDGLLYIPFQDKLEPEASKKLATDIENKLDIVIPASKL